MKTTVDQVRSLNLLESSRFLQKDYSLIEFNQRAIKNISLF